MELDNRSAMEDFSREFGICGGLTWMEALVDTWK